jgi:hypothetical protein
VLEGICSGRGMVVDEWMEGLESSSFPWSGSTHGMEEVSMRTSLKGDEVSDVGQACHGEGVALFVSLS